LTTDPSQGYSPRVQVGDGLALWIYDSAAKRILALPADHPVSRWVIVGEVLELPPAVPIGFWFHVAFIEERRPLVGEPDKLVRYGINPGQALIRWDCIYIAQRLAEAKAPEDPRPDPGLYL
jgi:hypothetical protein